MCEAIRGNATAAADSASGDKDAVRKNEVIAQNGVSDVENIETL